MGTSYPIVRGVEVIGLWLCLAEPLPNFMKKIMCFIFKHIWTDWIWSEDMDYAVRRCKRCKILSWGGTLEFIQTFPSALENPEIITR